MRQVVAPAFAPAAPVFVAAARGALVTDVDGNTFLDLSGGMGVLNVGHAQPAVTRAVVQQAGRFLHTDFSIVPYENLVDLAERLIERAPVPLPAQAAFFNSGAEAVENAVKISRLATRRRAVIAFTGGFHGRTALAAALTSRPRPYKAGMGPLAPEVYRAPYAYCYRCPLGASYPDCGVACADAFERVFDTQVDAEEVACAVVEPVQGEGGFIVPPAAFLTRVAEACRRRGVLLVVDEIQTGFGRTARWFASEWFGLAPDLVTVAKSLAAGLPLSGVVGRREVMLAAGPGTVGGTYVGNPVAAAAALAVLEVMEGEGLLARAERLGQLLQERLRTMAERHPLIGDVRALGPMAGIELVRDRRTKEPAARETEEVLREALSRGVIAVRCGIYQNVIRFLNPLTIEEAELEEALDVLDASLAAVEARFLRA
ncbi:MAG: 4-aminobutyrate--2-oxoglutarate transaminase [Clostridia bacterium]|nr:4-aminobutyrate--2-oxoglutarate transaminase [Clostridia bacterium]